MALLFLFKYDFERNEFHSNHFVTSIEKDKKKKEERLDL